MITGHCIMPKIEITQEMLDAGMASVRAPLTFQDLMCIYRAMRSREPGPADPGVLQERR